MPGLINSSQQKEISEQRRLPVDDVSSDAVVNISGETVQLYYFNSGVLTADAGQLAGTLVVGKLANRNILGALGDVVGNDTDTSVSFTSTALTVKLPFNHIEAEKAERNQSTLLAKAQAITSGFGNGNFCIDHRSGTIYGIKASNTTTLTATSYKIIQNVSGAPSGGSATTNITKIGGVTVTADDSAFTVGTTPVIPGGFLADETATDSVNEGDVGAARMTLDRKLITAGSFKEDTAHADGDYGLHAMTVRKDTAASTAGTDGDYSSLISDNAGFAYVRDKAYNVGSLSNLSSEVYPLYNKYDDAPPTPLTNIAANTTGYIYFPYNQYRNMSLQIVTSGTAPTDTLTYTFEVSNQDDSIANASKAYTDVTLSFFGSASVTDADSFWAIDTMVPFVTGRLKYVTSNTGGNDADLAVYAKKQW